MVTTWVFMDIDRDRRINAALLQQTDAIGEQLYRDLKSRNLSVQHIADRWEYLGQLDAGMFEVDATGYLRDYPGFRALSIMDTDFVAQQVVPSANSRALGRNIADISADRRRALEKARDMRQITLTDPIELVDGSGVGFITFTPVHQGDTFLGVLGTIFHVTTWLTSFFDSQENMLQQTDHLKVTLNGTPIFTGASFAQNPQMPTVSPPHVIYGQSLVVFNKRHDAFVQQHMTYLPEIISLFVGLLTLSILALWANTRRLNEARAISQNQHRALHKSNKELTSEVHDRQAAELEAKKADEAKSRFLAVMSHEIRTPLNAIMGMFELIERADVPDRQKRQAQSGYRAAHRLFDELTKVLDVSRIDAGAVTINHSLVMTDVAFEDWAAQLSAMITSSGKDIQVATSLSPEVPRRIWIDFDRTTQVLNNLINNAVKFTRSGQIRFAMQINEETKDLELSVSDTGQGIAAEQIPQAFGRFYQLKGGLNRSAQGSGLGLSICKDLANLMEGDIDVTSTLHEGSTFTLRLRNYTNPHTSSLAV